MPKMSNEAAHTDEKPIRYGPTICLIKGCGGTTAHVRAWSGVLLRTMHEHAPPPPPEGPHRG